MIRYLILEKDYSIVEAWWEARSWTPVSKDMLSSLGMMYTENGKDLCAMWLYPVVDSNLMWVGFPIANPDSTKELRDRALANLFKEALQFAKNAGYKIVMTTSGLPHVQERLVSYGFIPGDESVTQYFARVD